MPTIHSRPSWTTRQQPRQRSNLLGYVAWQFVSSRLNPSRRYRGDGFTLAELLVVVAIIAMLSALAIPQWRTTSAELRAWSWQRELGGSLERARGHTIGFGTAVTVCGGTPASGCQSTGWSDGWLVFEDSAGERQCSAIDSQGRCHDHGGKLLELGRGVPESLSVVGNYHVRNGVHYSPDHWGVTPGTFTISHDGRELGRLVISRAGRVRRAGPS